MSTPQADPGPGYERHLFSLVRPRGIFSGFVRQIASRERLSPPSHNAQSWAVQDSFLAPSYHQQDFRGMVPTVVMLYNIRQSSRQPDYLWVILGVVSFQ